MLVKVKNNSPKLTLGWLSANSQPTVDQHLVKSWLRGGRQSGHLCKGNIYRWSTVCWWSVGDMLVIYWWNVGNVALEIVLLEIVAIVLVITPWKMASVSHSLWFFFFTSCIIFSVILYVTLNCCYFSRFVSRNVLNLCCQSLTFENEVWWLGKEPFVRWKPTSIIETVVEFKGH